METILISGATGTIGSQLIPMLIREGYQIRILSRKKFDHNDYFVYQWDISNNFIEEGALDGVDHIIHLSGSNVSEGRWTKKRKKEIYDSRIKAADLIFSQVKTPIKTYVSASGSSYYGTVTTNQIFKESDSIQLEKTDFLGQISHDWEKAALQFEKIAQRVVIVRTPVVLSETGGALQKMSKPIKLGFGSPLGNGNQWMPWVHIDDLCAFYLASIKNNQLNGPYNAVAPEHVTNKDFTYAIANVLGKKIWLPKIPSFALKLVYGEMAGIILKGSRVSGALVNNFNFTYQYPKLEHALKDLLKSRTL